MLDFFKGLLSSEKIVDAGIKSVDAAFYMDEEKEADAQKADALKLEFIKASMPMEVARRFMAVSVTMAWLVNGAVCMLAVLADLIIVWNGWTLPNGAAIPSVFKAVSEFGLWYVMPPFTTVSGFYFWKRMRDQDKAAKQ